MEKLLLSIILAAAVLAAFVDSKSVTVDKQRHQRIKQQYLNLFKAETGFSSHNPAASIHVDISHIARIIPKDGVFSYMLPVQKRALQQLIHILRKQPTVERALEVADNIKKQEKIHEQAWYYAVTAWSLSDPRMQAIPKPSPVDIMPTNFIHVETMAKAAQISQLKRGGIKTDECVVIDGEAGVDNGHENDVWYFREDLMNNAFHMFWHLYYTEDSEVRQDRRSELFYFMHRDILARFEAERIVHRLPRTKSMVWGPGSLIEEPYYPHLNTTWTNFDWGDRQPNTPLEDIEFPPLPPITLELVKLSESRIYGAINTDRLLLPDGSYLPINNVEGTDILGDIIEGNSFGLNPDYYFPGIPVHGSLHLAIGIAGRPDEQAPFGVMLSPSTSFRDVVFYAWHLYINDLFDGNKQRLRPYTPTGGELPLVWNGITVTEVGVQPQTEGPTTNQLFTFFGERQFELSKGLDHLDWIEQPVNVCAKHLDHEEFVYKIVVNSDNFFTRPATVRIFLVPREDENNVRFNMREQRDLIFTLDVFQTTLQPGENVIYRSSNASTATIPWHQVWNELENGTDDTPACGCGLPHHLNIPRGRPEGMTFDLVALITNFVDDAVEYEEPDCRPAYLYCGLPNTKYPDAKPMGYPFDRLPYNVDANGNPSEDGTPVRDLDEYVRHVPNMATSQVVITHMGDRTGKN